LWNDNCDVVLSFSKKEQVGNGRVYGPLSHGFKHIKEQVLTQSHSSQTNQRTGFNPEPQLSNKLKNLSWTAGSYRKETLRFFYFCLKTLEPEVITNYPTTGNDLLWNIISILVLSLMTCCCDEFAYQVAIYQIPDLKINITARLELALIRIAFCSKRSTDIKCAVHVSTIISMLPLTLITHNICNWHEIVPKLQKEVKLL